MLEVVVVPFIPGRLTLMWTFESYQVILSVHIMWQRKRRCTWYCIRHALSHLLESLMRFVFCFLVTGQGKIILQIYCMPMVLRGVNRMNKCARAHHHKCNPLQHLDVMRINLRNGRSVFLSPRWILSELPPGSSVPSSWCSKSLLHSKVMCPLSYIGVSD